jgi:hypothetical protein
MHSLRYIYDPAENDDIPFEQLPDAGLARNVSRQRYFEPID